MNKCPHCAQEIDGKVNFCPFCGGKLAQKKSKWYFRTSSLIVGFLLLGPLILPLVWANPQYSARKKIIITAACLLFTLLLTVFFVNTLSGLMQYYQELNKALLNGTY